MKHATPPATAVTHPIFGFSRAPSTATQPPDQPKPTGHRHTPRKVTPRCPRLPGAAQRHCDWPVSACSSYSQCAGYGLVTECNDSRRTGDLMTPPRDGRFHGNNPDDPRDQEQPERITHPWGARTPYPAGGAWPATGRPAPDSDRIRRASDGCSPRRCCTPTATPWTSPSPTGGSWASAAGPTTGSIMVVSVRRTSTAGRRTTRPTG